ncbi:MAG: uracil-DNA glycosylase family protein [Burkholderiales bacterium]
MSLVATSRRLSARVARLKFGPPVTHVYNPLEYARAPHEHYLERYGAAPKEVVLVGMNPGPFGMAQTGVPFGDVRMVRDWMGISARVMRPKDEHPKRPVLGFDCPRTEVSGTRLWGWARDRFGSPEAFFARFFVLNYCPLCFMEASGRNFTPDALPRAEREPLFEACDEALRKSVAVLRPQFVVGVGAFAAGRASSALAGSNLTIGSILHPSPANPKANRGWARIAERELTGLGVRLASAAPRSSEKLLSHR